MMDVHDGAVLGQHALAYTLLSFFAITIHRRLRWFTVPSQAVQILPLFGAAHAVRSSCACSRRHAAGLGTAAGAGVRVAAVAARHAGCCSRRSARARSGRESAAVKRASQPCVDLTELKNVEQELSRFRTRLCAAAAFVLFCFGLLTARLVYLQVYRHDELSTQAENNRIAVVPIVPNAA
jgi:hypothetical protein